MTAEEIKLKRAAKLARVLGSPVRLHILSLLRTNDICVSTMVESLQRSQGNISQHLMVLRAAGLVVTERDGLRILYRLRDEQVAELVDRLLAKADDLVELDAVEVMQRKSCDRRSCGSKSRRMM